VLFIIGIFVIAHNDSRSVVVVAMTTVLELLGIGAVFTWIARFKS
jgi:hypothetical protein